MRRQIVRKFIIKSGNANNNIIIIIIIIIIIGISDS